jgi:hypothetical protein
VELIGRDEFVSGDDAALYILFGAPVRQADLPS